MNHAKLFFSVMFILIVAGMILLPIVSVHPNGVPVRSLQDEDMIDYPVNQHVTSGTDPVDTNSVSTYGTVSNFVNMQDTGDTDFATLTEENVGGGTSWTTRYTQAFEDTSLSGWYVSRWSRTTNPDSVSPTPSGALDNIEPILYAPSGYVYSTNFIAPDVTATMYMTSYVDTRSVSQVQVQLDLKTQIKTYVSGQSYFKMYFRDSGGNWDQVYSTTFTNSWFTIQETTSDNQYLHSGFGVKMDFYSGNDILPIDAAWVDNLVIRTGITTTNYRMSQEFQFTTVDFDTYPVEELHVNLETAPAEGLVVQCYSGSSWVTLGTKTDAGDTTYNVLPYLTSSTFTVRLVDTTTSSDGTSNSWQVDALYLNLDNNVPTNDGTPTTDSDYAGTLLAAKSPHNGQYAYITTYHNDADGYQNINTVTIEGLIGGVSYWKVSYDVGTDSYSLVSGGTYITVEAGTVTANANDLDITWHIKLLWAHPETVDLDIRCTVSDGLDSTTNTYDLNWAFENDLDLSSFALDDGKGTPSRGDIGSQVSASGTVIYEGTSVNPDPGEVDVWIVTTLSTGSASWEATLQQADGTFSATVSADTVVGLDTYTFKVVTAGGGSGGVDLLHTSHQIDYIADRIVCVALTSPQQIVDSMATGYMDVWLQYEYDNSNVTSGDFTLNGLATTRIHGGTYRASYSPGTTVTVTYDTVEIVTADSHGLGSVNMNGHSLSMYWEAVNCYVSEPFQNTVYIGENASGIYVWGEYTYWNLHGVRYYDGTLNLNNTQFTYDTVGTRGYQVISIDGDDTYGITTIGLFNTTSITWIYPAPQWDPEPSDQTVEIGSEFTYSLSAIAPGGVDLWWVNDTTHFSITMSGVVSNKTVLVIGIYVIQVWLNNTQNDIITAIFTVTVQDTQSPIWVINPENQNFDSLVGFEYQLYASDYSGIDSWWLNDTTHFAISPTGLVTNATLVVIGDYGLTLYVNDTLGHITTATIRVTVYDYTLLSWAEEPTDFQLEYGNSLHYVLSVDAPKGVSTYWVDDTTNFEVDDFGVISSPVSLLVGDYPLHIWVNDTMGRTITAEIVISVVDTTAPSWETVPTGVTIEEGAKVDLRFSATDLSGISRWSVDDTVRFAITTQGWLFNLTALPAGAYSLTITVFDIYNNNRSAEIQIVVKAAEAPTWDFIPEDRTLELGDDFYYQLGANDDSGISEWWLNDTKFFTIDSEGIIRNKMNLEVGVYGVAVYVSDTLRHTNMTSFRITVRDTTPPEWIETPPRTVLVVEGDPVGFDLDAEDLSTPLAWSVNDTERFAVNGTGYVINIVDLEPSTYWILVTVSDIYGNSRTAEIAIIVSPETNQGGPGIPDFPMVLISIIIAGAVVVVIVVILFAKGRLTRALSLADYGSPRGRLGSGIFLIRR